MFSGSAENCDSGVYNRGNSQVSPLTAREEGGIHEGRWEGFCDQSLWFFTGWVLSRKGVFLLTAGLCCPHRVWKYPLLEGLPTLFNSRFCLSFLFSCSVLSDSFPLHGLQHARLPWPPLSLGVCSNSVLWVSDAVQLSHSLSPPSPPALNLFQHQGLFQWVSSSYQVAKVLELQLQHQSFQWIFRVDSL